MQKRTGYSLLELLVVISMTGTLMVLATGWIHQTMKFSTKLKNLQGHHQNLTRLARELRDDVRQSDAISLEGETQLLIKSAEGNETRVYEIASNSITLKKLQNGNMVQKETLNLPHQSSARWDSSEMPNWISLIVERDPTPAGGSSLDTPVDLHVRVGPNRWRNSINSSTEGDNQ